MVRCRVCGGACVRQCVKAEGRQTIVFVVGGCAWRVRWRINHKTHPHKSTRPHPIPATTAHPTTRSNHHHHYRLPTHTTTTTTTRIYTQTQTHRRARTEGVLRLERAHLAGRRNFSLVDSLLASCCCCEGWGDDDDGRSTERCLSRALPWLLLAVGREGRRTGVPACLACLPSHCFSAAAAAASEAAACRCRCCCSCLSRICVCTWASSVRDRGCVCACVCRLMRQHTRTTQARTRKSKSPLARMRRFAPPHRAAPQ